MRALFVILLAAMLAGCESAPKKSLAPALQSRMGTQVTLVGIAEPRKGGAALKGEDFYVWLLGVYSWPEDVAMKRVEVKGRLEEDHGLPVIRSKPGGPIMQGIPVPEGTDLEEASRRLIIVDPTWRLVE